MPTIKVKNLKTGEWEKLPTVKGEDGKDYILTGEDKEEIADIVKENSEEWTFTLEDGTSVTKKVVLG